MKMKRWLLNLIVIGGVSLTAIGIAGGVVLKSYAEYQEYYKENYPEIDPADYATLLSISAEFKPGVQYYKNNLAKPAMEDFIVTGTYQPKKEEEEIFEQVLDPKKRPYEVIVGSRFAFIGGEITIKYGSFSDTLYAELQDVVLEKLSLDEKPYTIKYEVGEVFSSYGMEVSAVFNDGEKRLLSSNEYQISNTNPLTKNDKNITISYQSGDKTLTSDIKISVVDHLDNGSIKSIAPSKNYFDIADGAYINNASIVVVGTYESGNRIELGVSQYHLTNENQIARFGKQYILDAEYTQNSKIKTSVNLRVKHHIEGESGVIVGGKSNTEDEYAFNNGTLTKVGSVTFAGDFGKAVTAGSKGTVTYKINSYVDGSTDIDLRCANSNLSLEGNEYWMKPLQVNTVLDLFVNGEPYEIDNTVVLAGAGPHTSYAPLYNVYKTFTFEDVPLNIGENEIVLSFKKSTINEKNYWNESPSTMNIDYLDFTSLGKKIDPRIKVRKIEIDSNFKINFGDNFDSMEIPVIATYTNGEKELLNNNELTISKPSGYAGMGTHQISVVLKSNPNIFDTKNYVVGDVILEAENASISGSEKVVTSTEVQYYYNSDTGSYDVGDTTTVVKGMDNSATKYSGETSLTFSFKGAQGLHALVVKCDNAYYFQETKDNKTNYWTKAMNLNQAIQIFVNDVEISFSAELPAIDNVDNPDVCWMSLYEFGLGNISLNNGTNTIRIVARKTAPKNHWSEYSIPRFDYIKLTTAK